MNVNKNIKQETIDIHKGQSKIQRQFGCVSYISQ